MKIKNYGLLMVLTTLAACSSQTPNMANARMPASVEDENEGWVVQSEVDFSLDEKKVKVIENQSWKRETHTKGKFGVEIDGVPLEDVISVEGTFRKGKGAIVIVRGWDPEKKENRMALSQDSKNDILKSVSVVYTDETGREESVDFSECRWKAPELNSNSDTHKKKKIKVELYCEEMK